MKDRELTYSNTDKSSSQWSKSDERSTFLSDQGPDMISHDFEKLRKVKVVTLTVYIDIECVQ